MQVQTIDSRSEVKFSEILTLLKRRVWMLFIGLGIGLLLGGAAILLTKTSYRVSSRIVVTGRTQLFPNVSTNDALSEVAPTSLPDIPSQLEVVSSFNTLAEAMSLANVPIPQAVSLDTFDPQLTVRQVGQTNVLEITLESEDPQKARNVAEQVPIAYRNFVRNQQAREFQGAVTFAEGRLNDAQERLKEREKAAEEFRKKNQLGAPDTDASERIARLTQSDAELRSARTRLAESEAYRIAITRARVNLPATIKLPEDRTNLAQIQQQEQIIANLKAERSRLLADFTPNSPAVKAISAQIQEQEAFLKRLPKIAEINSVARNPLLNNYDDKVAEAEARAVGARSAVSQAEQRYKEASAAMEKFRRSQLQQVALQREMQDLGNVVASLTKTLEDLRLKQSAARETVTVVAQPSPPLQVRPRPTLYISIGALLGLVLGVLLVALAERSDERIYAPLSAFDMGGVRALGYIPVGSARNVLLNPASRGPVLEGYRVLRSNVGFSPVGQKHSTLMLVSGARTEARPELSANLAIAFALEKRKVVIVDANLRRPALQTVFGVEATPGLSEVLQGKAELSSCVRTTGTEGLSLLTAGQADTSAAELLSSEKFESVLESLKQEYELVVVDVPPILAAAADVQAVASHTDATIFVVELGKTKRSALTFAVDLLRQANANLIGIVYSRSKLQTGGVPYEFEPL